MRSADARPHDWQAPPIHRAQSRWRRCRSCATCNAPSPLRRNASTSATTGRSAIAASVRSLPRSASTAAKLARSVQGRSGRGCGEGTATRLEDVGRRQADAGIDQQDRARRQRRRRRKPLADAAEASAARPAKHIGTSAPSRAARSNSSSTGSATRHRSISACSAAAASAEPPPRPAATGMCLVSLSAARGATPARSASRRAAFSTRLSAFVRERRCERPVDAEGTDHRTARPRSRRQDR